MQAVELVFQQVPTLCFLYWVLAAGAVAVTVLPCPVPSAFRRAVELSAARGKLWYDRPKALGRFENASVPQRWFAHFYIIGSAANAFLIVWLAASAMAGDATPAEAASLSAMSIFELHLARRALETLGMMVYPPDAKMHIVAYFFGLSYYLAVPVSLLPPSLFHGAAARQTLQTFSAAPQAGDSWRALLQAWHTTLHHAPVTTILGLLVFVLGNALQLASHWALASLQRSHPANSTPAKGTESGKAYSIPTGGMFKLVSCPHYLAEIIVYAGLLLLSQGLPAVWLMNVWVVFNLALAARATHSWYQKHFEDYPPSRKALLPFLF